jgi:hypothetical protein
MTTELWHATLNPRGPNYERLKGIFGESRVPLKSPRTVKAQLGEEKDVPVYLLDFSAMPLGQRARLFGMVTGKCGVPLYEVEKTAREQGFPIREADVIVSFGMRAFV